MTDRFDHCCGDEAVAGEQLLPADLCADLRVNGPVMGVTDEFDRRRFRREIPVGRVTVDCTPVSFRTPGQAVNVVSCPVSQTVLVPVPIGGVTQTACGCFPASPSAPTIPVPVTLTVNLPPQITPTAVSPIATRKCSCH